MNRSALVAILCVVLVGTAFASPASAQAKAGPKVFISVDMEGIWGVVAAEQTSATSPEYGAARKWMAEDVNAVVAGLLEAGAGEIVVNDSHGSMRNIVADALNPKASLISGSPKPLSMMQGIDATFDAVVFVGYHARAGTAAAILDHTISSGTIYSIKVNGQEMPELGLNALIAGYYKVPVIMLTGDTTTCAQAKAVLGDGLVTAAVKEATGRVAARLLPAGAGARQPAERGPRGAREEGGVPAVPHRRPLRRGRRVPQQRAGGAADAAARREADRRALGVGDRHRLHRDVQAGARDHRAGRDLTD